MRLIISTILLVGTLLCLGACHSSPKEKTDVKVSENNFTPLERIKERGTLKISILYDTARYIGNGRYPNNFQMEIFDNLAIELGVKVQFTVHHNYEGSLIGLTKGEYDLLSNRIPVAEMRSLGMGLVFPFSAKKNTRKLTYPLVELTDRLKEFNLFHQNSSIDDLQHEWGWMVSNRESDFKTYVGIWMTKFVKTKKYRDLKEKYTLKSQAAKHRKKYKKLRSVGKLSEYKEMIIKESEGSGIDWRLVASLANQESKFNPDAISPGGAMGLMQLVRATTKLYNVSDPYDPQQNLRAGIKMLMQIDKEFAGEIEDDEERLWFVVASYNAGTGHIADARKLARKYGRDPNVWEDNVDYYLKLKSDPEYYKDKVVRWGYCRGSHTVNFTREVMDRYFQYKATFPD